VKLVQRLIAFDLVRLAAGHIEGQRLTVGVRAEVDFGREAAARAAERFLFLTIDLDFRFTPTMRMARRFFATVSEGPRCSPNARVSWQALPCVRPRPKARRATEHNCDGATVHGATGAAGCCEWDNLMVMTS
jgi:hypothetical protein